MEIAARLKAGRVPAAPARTAPEVMHDPHMRERGMLADIEHPELGLITVPTSPLRLHGLGLAPAAASPGVGEHNAAIYGRWLGLSENELAVLKEEGVI
jgi:crotonobetainyl-CoA:carnitine CoA-transferase CaiB-like acyl-CoA transferase